MRRETGLVVFFLFMFVSCGILTWMLGAAIDGAAREEAASRVNDLAGDLATDTATRIVSLSPSTTEIVAALGAADRLVGITNFCTNPPGVAPIRRVGGFLDPNYEAIAALSPDLVIVLSVHTQAAPVFRSLGIRTLSVDHTGVEGILASIEALGGVCGASERAVRLAADLAARLERVKLRAGTLPPRRVLLSVERPLGSLKEVYIVGKDGFYDVLLAAAGGRNVYEQAVPRFPSLGAEAILKLDPDVIIELRVGAYTRGETDAAVLADWATLPALRAVRTGRVHVLRDPTMVIPGPRFAEIAERFLATIHPEQAEPRP